MHNNNGIYIARFPYTDVSSVYFTRYDEQQAMMPYDLEGHENQANMHTPLVHSEHYQEHERTQGGERNRGN